jgi:hypothetical protein
MRVVTAATLTVVGAGLLWYVSRPEYWSAPIWGSTQTAICVAAIVLLAIGLTTVPNVSEPVSALVGLTRRTGRRLLRWRPHFSLRAMFISVLLLALPMGWVAYQLNWIRERHEFIRKYEDGARAKLELRSFPILVPWSLRILGEDQSILFAKVPELSAKDVQRLFPEARINLPRQEWSKNVFWWEWEDWKPSTDSLD